jgi:hypothetical protein
VCVLGGGGGVQAVSSKAYLESCQKAAQTLAYAVLGVCVRGGGCFVCVCVCVCVDVPVSVSVSVFVSVFCVCVCVFV